MTAEPPFRKGDRVKDQRGRTGKITGPPRPDLSAVYLITGAKGYRYPVKGDDGVHFMRYATELRHAT